MIKHDEDITILGYRGTAPECPFDTETWGINIAGKQFPKKKVHYCFAFDELPPEYVKEMKTVAPVISFQEYADFPYPLNRIIKAFRTEYFVNSLCYMIAYAIFVGAKRLSLYGCDTLLGAMWQRESKGAEYWLGRAEERGIEVIVPRTSGLLRSMQGRPYHKDGREVLLTLQDRIALMRVLPINAPYDDALYAATLNWIFRPKGDEQTRYHIYVGYDVNGLCTAVCGEEFRVDIPMAEDVWNYLRKRMIEYEREYGLTSDMLGVYEMLTTSEWRDGEYKALGAKSANPAV